MKLTHAYNLLIETSINYDVLAHKIFDGIKNKIKIELIKFKNGSNPIIKIFSLNDPNKTGSVGYENKLSAIRAYNNLTDLVKVLNYMNDYINEPSSFEWINIIKDEDIELIKQNIPEQPSLPIGGQESSTPGGTLPEGPEDITPPGEEIPPEEKYPPAPTEEGSPNI